MMVDNDNSGNKQCPNCLQLVGEKTIESRFYGLKKAIHDQTRIGGSKQ